MKNFLKIAPLLAVLIVSSNQQSCSIMHKKDIGSSDLRAVSGQPQSNCCNICQNTRGCKGFAWNDYQGGTCWLKDDISSVVNKEGVNVGILSSSTSSEACSVTSGKDIRSNDLGSRTGQPLGSCCGICRSTPGCKAYAWNNHEGGTCWLKSATSPIIKNPGVTVGILSGAGNGGSGNGGGGNNGGLISFNEFSNAVVNAINGYPRPTQAQYDAYVQGLPKGRITTKEEAAMALTHILHESDGLQAKREYRCMDSGCPGEYAYPSCDAPGQRYYGRGYIQLTWCYNYRPASIDLFGDDRLVSQPDLVATDENIAWNTAFWFWKKNVQSKPGVSNGNFGATTRAVNGGMEYDDSAGHPTARKRYAMYGRIRDAFGLPGSGIETGCYN